MKTKFLLASLLVGASMTSFAQGYKDGIDFYKIGDYENARIIFERNINSASNQAEAYYYYGQIALQSGKVDEAKSCFDKGLAADPQYPYNYVGEGAILLKNGNKSAAEDSFKAARKLSKKDTPLEIAIARAYYAANPTTYDSQIRKSIANARKWHAESAEPYILEGDISAAKEDWGDATGKYEMAMTYEPTNIESTVKYADTYYRVAPELALDRLKGIIASNPNSALVQRQLSEKLYEHGDFTEAAQSYGNYISSTTNHFPKDKARYAQLLYFANDFQNCYDVASQLKSTLKPNDNYYIAADRMMMYSLENLNRWDEAAAIGKEMFSYQKGLDDQAFNYKDLVMYAKALEETKQPEEAIKYYNMAIEKNPDNVELARNLATQYADAKQFPQALAYAKKVLENQNHSDVDYASLANIYYKMAIDSATVATDKATAFAEGLKYADMALEAKPENLTYIYYKANLLVAQEGKNNGAALPAMQKLIDIIKQQENQQPYYGTLSYAYSYIALYYYGQKNTAKALEYFRAWLEIDPNNKGIADAIEMLSK